MARVLAWGAGAVVLGLAILWYISNASSMQHPATPQYVSIDGQKITVDLALTVLEQARGLGGRTGLLDHTGMLFIFPTDGVHKFWMKDMRFSIDMIWMASDGTVTFIQGNVSPSTYPEAFGPDNSSRYVLEVPANFAQTYNIKVGDKATLPR